MNEKQIIPTLEQYTEAVKISFKESMPNLSDSEVDDYIYHDEEAQQEIRTRYQQDVNALKSGEITLDVFNSGAVSSVAYCLSWLY